MDGRRFDALVRMPTAGRSRRAIGRVPAVGALAAALTQFGVEEMAAACKRVGRPCDKNRTCCSRACKQGVCHCRKPRERGTTVADCCGISMSCSVGPSPCAAGGKPRCCRIFNAPCASLCDCCDALSTCHGGRCCRPLGAPCSHPSFCCSGTCVDDSCAP